MEQVKKILWIDDDINRFPLMPYIDEFEAKDFTIVKAENPDESDDVLLKEKNFSCIIVDISMPRGEKIDFGEAKGGMQTGFVILKKLVEDSSLTDVKKVVFTIVDDADVRTYCRENGIPYLQKHKYYTDTIVQKIEDVIKN